MNKPNRKISKQEKFGDFANWYPTAALHGHLNFYFKWDWVPTFIYFVYELWRKALNSVVTYVKGMVLY